MKRLILTAIVMQLLLAGCGSGSGSGLALEDLAGRAAAAFCEKLYQCCNADEIAEREQKYGFSDEAGCRDYFGGGLEQFMVTPIRNAVAAGRGEYDAVKAQQCVDAFEELGCSGTDDPSKFFDSCELPYQGLQAAGAECVNSYECQPGLYCSTNTKTCQAFAEENGTCGASGEPYCSAGLYCDTSTTTCLKQKAENSACTATPECQAGLICDETSQTCTTPQPVCTGQ